MQTACPKKPSAYNIIEAKNRNFEPKISLILPFCRKKSADNCQNQGCNQCGKEDGRGHIGSFDLRHTQHIGSDKDDYQRSRNRHIGNAGCRKDIGNEQSKQSKKTLIAENEKGGNNASNAKS